MAQTIRLEIPNYLPPRELSPNARVHWRERFEAQIALRDNVIVSMTQQSIWTFSFHQKSTWYDERKLPWDKIAIKLIFYVKDARRRDKDNYIASMKAGLDAFQGRIIRDDKDIESISVEFVKDKAKAPMTAIEVRRRE